VGARVEVAAWAVAGFFVAVGVKMTGEEVAVCTGGKVTEGAWVVRGSIELDVGSLTEVGGCAEAVCCPIA